MHLRCFCVWSLLVLVLVTIDCGASSSLAQSQQRAILHELFTATNGRAWSTMCSSGWMESNQSECMWYGISCDGYGVGSVIGINLANCGLTGGPLPASLGNLTSLQSMDLSGNALTGPLPETLSQLAATLGQLYLYDNYLTGTLPAVFYSLTLLSDLRLMNNSLSGTLPEAWSVLSNLDTLWMSKNDLSGPLPPSWSFLSQLGFLDLSDNHLSGELPSSWSSWPDISTISLARNELSSTLPSSWSNLTNIQCLNLDGNAFTGNIPSSWSTSLTNLGIFTVANNSLTGALPDTLSAMLFLSELDFSSNYFSGPLPGSWAGMIAMGSQGVNVSYNCLETSSPVANESWWQQQIILPQRSSGQC